MVMWCLWTSLWLAVCDLGARYLPDPEATPGRFWSIRPG